MLVEGTAGTLALFSVPLIPFYLRRLTPLLEKISEFLDTIVESIKEGKIK